MHFGACQVFSFIQEIPMYELVELTDAELDMISGGQITVSFSLTQGFSADAAQGLSFDQQVALETTVPQP